MVSPEFNLCFWVDAFAWTDEVETVGIESEQYQGGFPRGCRPSQGLAKDKDQFSTPKKWNGPLWLN